MAAADSEIQYGIVEKTNEQNNKPTRKHCDAETFSLGDKDGLGESQRFGPGFCSPAS